MHPRAQVAKLQGEDGLDQVSVRSRQVGKGSAVLPLGRPSGGPGPQRHPPAEEAGYQATTHPPEQGERCLMRPGSPHPRGGPPNTASARLRRPVL